MSRITFPVIHFDDLKVGDEFESQRRTVTEADIVNFAGISGDFTAIHVDHEAARAGPFGAPIAHGILGMAIASGLGTMAPRAETVAFLGIADWKFLRPIKAGDTIHVLTKVASLEPARNGRRGTVTWERTVINQVGEMVQQGHYQTIVANRKRGAQSQGQDEPEATSEGGSA